MKNLNTILPFYDSTDEWYKYRDDIMIERKAIRLVCGVKRVMPFIIRRLTTGGTTTTLLFRIANADTGAVIQSPTPATYLNFDTGTTYDNIWYDASADFASDLPVGANIYIIIVDSSQTPTKTYYSDIITVVADVALSNYTLLEFSNDLSLNNIKGTFSQKIYIDNVFKTPDYLREDEGEKMDGILLRQSMTAQKVLNLWNMPTPEFLIDALVTLPMMDNIELTDINGDCFVPLEVRLKDPEWIADAGGSFAKLCIQFVEWVVIKKGGYKEVACNCESGGTSTAVIKEGSASLTASIPSVVTFATAFADAGYSLQIRAWTPSGSPIFPDVTSQLAGSFTLVSLVSGSYDWLAIRV